MDKPLQVTTTSKEVDLFVRLQRAIDASGGLVDWTEILLGIRRAKEKKLAEAAGAVVNSMTLAELFLAEKVAFRELEYEFKEDTEQQEPPIAQVTSTSIPFALPAPRAAEVQAESPHPGAPDTGSDKQPGKPNIVPVPKRRRFAPFSR